MPVCDAATFFVSQLGSNTDGRSWETAFTTIQKALDAIPNDAGGHRIVIRPDTYCEAMLFPAHKGAAGDYNQLIGDVDGKLGSGTVGRVIIDASDPKQQGFKSFDWWGPIRSYKKNWSEKHKAQTFSAIGWDRWCLRGLYVTGGDGGIFFDMTNQVKPFSLLVEDCVGIGRAFGGGVANSLSRADEPITFRRCHLWALDTWGDTAAAYVRIENKAMPEQPDVVFDQCTLVSPECALKGSNFGFHTCTRVAVRRSALIVLNFSQPQGTPSKGIIQSVQNGKLLAVDLEDSTLMGYKVRGVVVDKKSEKDLKITTKGDVKAYVQYQQTLPPGILRLGQWPVELFQTMLPPRAVRRTVFTEKQVVARDLCEVSAVAWKGRLCLLECMRPSHGGDKSEYYLVLKDAETGNELARCAHGYGLASALVHEDQLFIFASRWEAGQWKDVTLFHSADLRHWDSKIVIQGDNEGIFNSSVCRGRDEFIIAYESNDRAFPAFTIKFARSADLRTWTKIPAATFGTNRYTACPCIRFAGDYYYVLYLERRAPRWVFETYITRSRDLRHWMLSTANPVLRATGLDEGINASDPEVVEFNNKTHMYYAVGDQRTWMNVKRAVYDGSLVDFLQSWYSSDGVPDRGSIAGKKAED